MTPELDNSSGSSRGDFCRPTCRVTGCPRTPCLDMANASAKEFNEALCQRLRMLREEKGWSQEEMATALGIPAERYRKYEARSPLPSYLFPQLALISGRDMTFIVTGRPFRSA